MVTLLEVREDGEGPGFGGMDVNGSGFEAFKGYGEFL